jgi:uncharacterized protein (TIGR03435 family)
LTGVISAQSSDVKFEASDVHVSPKSNSFDRYMRGPFVRAGRYEIRTASMLDLVSTAYGMDPERVYGGPNWLEMDRFEVIGKIPPGTKPEGLKLMLQALLAERFHLKVHQDKKELAAFALTAEKHPLLKESDGSEAAGCKNQLKGLPNGPLPEGAPPPKPEFDFDCHNMTMAAFVDGMRDMPLVPDVLSNKPVVDRTDLKGAWDFKFTLPIPGRMMGPQGNYDVASIFDVMQKQLGLKLEAVKSDLPVIVVDSVNEKPSANLPDVVTTLAGSAPPTEFEVADIKPADPAFQGLRFNIEKGGRVTIQNATLKFIIEQVWNVTDEMLLDAPKWLDDEHWDVIAKAPSSVLSNGGPNTPPIDYDSVLIMLQSMLAERFKLKTHMEDRPISAYTLLAAKPKMKQADPAGRTKCFEGPGPDGKDPRNATPILGRLITCQNMSMGQLADLLQGLASGYIHAPVLDSTGLAGNWDFTLSFSTAGQLQGRGGDKSQASPGAAASDPNGALSLLDALPRQLGLKLEMQKRPIRVLVIDHVEQKPTDN